MATLLTTNVFQCRNNVLIGLDGSAKLTDFGVSVIMTNAVDTIEPAGPGNR